MGKSIQIELISSSSSEDETSKKKHHEETEKQSRMVTNRQLPDYQRKFGKLDMIKGPLMIYLIMDFVPIIRTLSLIA